MKTAQKTVLFASLACSVALTAAAQSYSIDWYKVAAGGGTSTGGNYSLSGTVGQPDASGPLTGGDYSLTGGFWSLVASTAGGGGVPTLTIKYAAPNSVIVSWPKTGAYSLQQKSGLNTGIWAASGYPVTTANGTNSITIRPPTGSLFFRLAQ